MGSDRPLWVLTDRLGAGGGPLEGHNVLPLTRVRPSDDRHHRLGGAQVEHLVRDAWGDEDKVPGRILQRVLQARTVLMPHPALQDVQHDLKTYVNVRVRHPAGRDRGHVEGQVLRPNILARQTSLIPDAVPRSGVTATTDRKHAVVPFRWTHRAARL